MIRYEVDNLEALNFVCHGALGGGVSRSLCLDNYGKALSAAILGFEIEVPDALRDRLRRPAAGGRLTRPGPRMAGTKHTILVAGASGVVGSAAVEHFAALPDWRGAGAVAPAAAAARRACATSRSTSPTRRPAAPRRPTLGGVTHLLYAALYELPELVAGWRDPRQMAVNEAMLRNLLDALEAGSRRLRHVTILQGTKAYGGHVEPAPVPAKERSPRHRHENFYWLQEDLLRERQPHAAWTFSVLRPQIVFGHAVSSPMNIVAAVGAYAAIRRELGLPLAFPGGGPLRQRRQRQPADRPRRRVRRHARGRRQRDLQRRQRRPARLARPVGVGGAALRHADRPRRAAALAAAMPAHEDAWARVVDRHGLRPLTLDQLVGSSWQFTDRAFGHGLERAADSVLSTIKLRQHGFADCEDTEDSLHHWLERMQAERLLPR